ncbi:unnamed protein product, partial [marine sediment metagenome]
SEDGKLRRRSLTRSPTESPLPSNLALLATL